MEYYQESMTNKAYSVTEVNRYIKNLVTEDFLLKKLTISGEVSNVKYHSSGHVYFSIKDDNAAINAVMFATYARMCQIRLKEGMKILATGNVDVYEKTGTYQFYVKNIQSDGEGDLYRRFVELKNELQEMGMFESEYKKAIPKYIRTLGVVTASTGAAIQDIINITKRRNPYVQIILYPAQVQGNGAAHSIANGIRNIIKYEPDVIIVGRGGGSLEDLFAFNEREVAEAIFNSPIPIVSAVGHEVDTTISDYVADLRAPTPSAAAELCVFSVQDYYNELENIENSLKQIMLHKLNIRRNELLGAKLLLERLSPQNRISDYKMRLMDLEEQCQVAINDKVFVSRKKLEIMAAMLDGLSPLKNLSNGHAVIEGDSGKLITSIKDVNVGDKVRVHIHDGDILAETIKKETINY